MSVIQLSIFGRSVRIECRVPRVEIWFSQVFGAMSVPEATSGEPVDVEYVVERAPGLAKFSLQRAEREWLCAANTESLLFTLEKDLTIELQKLRRDLYFVHAAALQYEGQVVILVGPPRSGKSTTSWALLHHGFRYMSDELAPIDLKSMTTLPYPHALCLKKRPPRPYDTLPGNTLQTSATFHVPAECLPGGVVRKPGRLSTVLFVRHASNSHAPEVRELSAAEAGARLFANSLNSLAHPNYGVDAALRAVHQSRCFELMTTDLGATCELIQTTLSTTHGT